nr:MAG TPA: hypothetical protein [Caudoviricetes sp.]
MAEYFDREVCLSILRAKANMAGLMGAAPYFEKAAKMLEKLPTVDAVVVTRGKDCKYKGRVQEPCHGKSVDYCKVWDCTLRNLESTFCSYGEPKEGAHADNYD